MIEQALRPAAVDRARILVVEDDEDIQAVLCDIMEGAGYDVLRVESGVAALELLERDPIDLVLLDIMLPDMDGYELCAQLRSNGAARLPILMLTALSQPQHVTRGLESGADDYLKKPFMPEELLLRAKNLLRRHQDTQGLTQEVAALHTMLDLVQRQLAVAQGATQVEATLRRELLHNVTTHLEAMCGIVDAELRKLGPSAEREAVQRIRSRLRGATLVYQVSGALQSDPVAIDTVIRTTASALKSMYRPWKRIVVNVQGPPLELPLTLAAPLAMIVNELVTNCFKHAFPDNRFGTIDVSYTCADQQFALEVADDGVGFDPAHPGAGRGRATVAKLAQSLGGSVEWQHEGACMRAAVRVPLPAA